MSEQDLDRNEEATPYKLQKAREKGQVAKSNDVVSVCVLLIALVFLYWRGLDGMQRLFQLDATILNGISRLNGDPAELWGLSGILIREILMMMLPLFLALMLGSVVANVMQTGPILSSEPIKVDFTKLNPVNGLKRFFSMRSLFDLARVSLKLILLSLVVYFSLKSLIAQFYKIANFPALQALNLLLEDVVSVGFKMALMLVLIAFVDLIYSRREFGKKMRMSKRDVKDEAKNRDGDPRIRSRLRELRREMLKRSLAAAKTKDADVVITNPTHIAVALKYEHGKMDSPQLLAKGAGSLAAAMRKVAGRHQIPVVQNRSLARRLFHEVDFDQHVPQHLYADVAKIMIWILAMRKSRQNQVRETLS